MSIHELQAALRALDEAADGNHTANAAEVYATARVIEAARRVAEGAGTAPPSTDALVEALGKLSAEWRIPIPPEKESCEYGIDAAIEFTRKECADALDALIAKHKENSR